MGRLGDEGELAARACARARAHARAYAAPKVNWAGKPPDSAPHKALAKQPSEKIVLPDIDASQPVRCGGVRRAAGNACCGSRAARDRQHVAAQLADADRHAPVHALRTATFACAAPGCQTLPRPAPLAAVCRFILQGESKEAQAELALIDEYAQRRASRRSTVRPLSAFAAAVCF